MWTVQDIGDQSGRIALVTGGNSGIGFHTARHLRDHGATVVLGCRDEERARAAAAALEAGGPGAPVRLLPLDLASLASVRKAADELRADTPQLDLLVCNAGVMLAPPQLTEDGFEPHMGINHLGHFALTGRLLDRLLETPGSRVVVVASLGYRLGRLSEGALERGRGRLGFLAYARSKLANLLFVQELHLLGVFVLMLVHSAHRFRYTLYDGLQVKKKRTVAVLCYGAAIVGSVATLAVLWAAA